MLSSDEQTIRKGFSYLDSGITAAIGVHAERVYEELRRRIWRSNVKVGGLYSAKGPLVSHKVIAQGLGVHRNTVYKALALLKEIGWIRVSGKLNERRYDLGVHPNVYYADTSTTVIVEKLYDLAREKGFVDGKGNPSLSAIPSNLKVDVAVETLGCRGGKLVKPTSKITSGFTPEVKQDTMTKMSGFTSEVQGCTIYVKPVSHEKCNRFHTKSETLLHREKHREKHREELSCGFARKELFTPPTDVETFMDEVHALNTKVKEESSAPNFSIDTNDSEDSTVLVDSLGNEVQVNKKELEAIIAAAKEKSRASKQKQLEKRQKRDDALRNLGGTPGGSAALSKAQRGLESVWEERYKANFPDVPFAKWSGKEKGQLKQLTEKYKVGDVETLFRFCLDNWESAIEGFKSKPVAPTVGFLLRLHDSFMPKAVKYQRVVDVYKEWKAWWAANPNEDDPPDDLERRFEACRSEIEELGLLRKA